MCKAISIMKSRVNVELYEEHELQSRTRKRCDTAPEEIVFEFADRKHTPQLPKTGWCRQESLEAGKWRWLAPEKVVIPAQLGQEKGIWFSITEGIEGVLVLDEGDRPHVYMVTQEASTYFQNMTRRDRMPVLVGEQI